jgi:PAS domain S-box-containing protein
MSDGPAKSQSFVTRAKTFSSVAAGFVMLVGVLVLIGWLFDLERLKSGYGPITMKANAAISLMLAAVSVWTLRASNPYQKLGQICAAGAGLIGFVTLSEHITGWNLHIDQLLFAEAPGALATTSPGRMGITASSCFVLYGIALFLLHRRRAVSIAQALSIIAGFWAFLAIIGFTYQTQALFGISRFTGIALPTAMALFVLCLSILAASIKQGMLSVVSDETAAGIMTRRLVVVAVSVPFVMGWLRLAGQRAGYFDLGFGTALSVSVLTVIFLFAIWRAGIRLQEVEQRRLATEAVASEGEERGRRQAALIDLSYEPIFLWDLTSGIIEWNKGCEQLYGYSEGEAIGRRSHELLRTEFPVSLQNYQEALDHEGSWSGELRHITKDGREVLVESRQQLIWSQSQRLVLETNRDITERKSREQQLAEQREWLRLTMHASRMGTWTRELDTTGRVDWSPELEQLFGFAPGEFPGTEEAFIELVHPEDRQTVSQAVADAIKNRTDYDVEFRYFTIGGRMGWMLGRGSASYDAAGRPIRLAGLGWDITERKLAERAQAQLAGIVESSEDVIISKTLDGIIDSWNGAAERLFGYSAQEAIGNSITIIIPHERLDEERLILERLRKGERLEHFETVRMAKSGQRVDLSLTVSPIRNQHGAIIGASKIARDVTERRRAERERERLLLQERSLRAEAERIARLKDEFLATISHELRTPLNAILGWATILRKGAPNQSTADHAIEAIERNAKSQAQLIEDLLDVSRIIAGNLRIDFKPIAISSVIKAAMDSVQPAAEAKEIHLQIIVDPLADTIRGDAERLQQVIWNLLSNSIKFTPRGGHVTVKVERNGSDAQLTLTDTGEGISSEFLPFVFDRFKQADGSSTRKHGGLGLGLAISRHLTEMHGGTIEVHSDGEGLGSTFRIRLPLADVSAIDSSNVVAVNEAPLARDQTRLDGIRLLIVDDHVDAREMLRVILEECGADVTTASSTRDTLAVLSGLRPDVIVSDIGMPGEDGYDLIRKVRALSAEQGGTTPAIALTGYVRVEERMRALAAGYQMFVPKPVEVEELSAIITTLVRRGAG